MNPKNVNSSNISPHVSALIDSFIPEHIRQNFPELIKFIEAYFNYLEDVHGSVYYQNTLSSQRDIELQEESFLREIESEVGLYVPRKYESSPRLFYNQISEIYRSKGSKEAIELFFRLFLNDPVRIRFPWDQVLKPSDGRWNIDNKLRVTMIRGSGDDFLGRKIFQIEQFATSVVEKVERRLYSDSLIFELTLSVDDSVGTFVSGNTIKIEDSDLEAEIYRSVSKIVPTNPGQNYRKGEKVELDNYDGYSFIGFVSSVDNSGGIVEVTLSNFGAGNTPQHVINDPNNTNQYYFKDFLVYDRNTDELVEAVIPEFTVNTKFGVDAEFDILFSPIVTTAGRYSGVRGQLSESIVLQDSDFYQKYSYEVVGNNSIDTWLKPLKQTVHLAGAKVFSNINIYNKLDFKVDSEFFSQFFEPANYTLGENSTIFSEALGFSQDYVVGEGLYFRELYVGIEEFEFTDVSQSTPLPSEQRAFQSGL